MSVPLLKFASILWLLANFAVAVLVGRLIHLGLYKRYPWFFTYLLLDVVVGVTGLTFGLRSAVYCDLYWWSQPVYLVLTILVVREVFTGLYEEYPGLRLLTRQTLVQCVFAGLFLAGCCVPLAMPTWNCPGFRCHFFAFLELKRFFVTGLAAFTPLMLVRLSRMPNVHIDSNTRWHAHLFTLMLVGEVATLLIAFLAHSKTVTLMCSVAGLLVNSGCYCAWILCLRRAVARPKDDLGRHAREAAILMSRLSEFSRVCELLRRRPSHLPSD